MSAGCIVAGKSKTQTAVDYDPFAGGRARQVDPLPSHSGDMARPHRPEASRLHLSVPVALAGVHVQSLAAAVRHWSTA